jgi:hypothetical protein
MYGADLELRVESRSACQRDERPIPASDISAKDLPLPEAYNLVRPSGVGKLEKWRQFHVTLIRDGCL